MSWNIEYYETESGKKPAYEFIQSLPIKLEAKAYLDIGILEQFGTQLTMPYSRFVKDGLFELRIQQAGSKARIFYFFIVGRNIILTNGFLKKTKKTPPHEISKALKYKSDYERRQKL
ncbi:MAG: type II toxin-antitoxin system RelE/ParE family toxin [Oscillospiraceae bacterium]|nr:type II toxin-antitoxin system RelE/ParE family toxin [Oscillospiraceae bacterium]